VPFYDTVVLGEGNDPSDNAHVAVSAPIELKRKELPAGAGDKTYRTPLAPNTPREKSTTKKRIDKEGKPI
jgi:hypothetical protein